MKLLKVLSGNNVTLTLIIYRAKCLVRPFLMGEYTVFPDWKLLNNSFYLVKQKFRTYSSTLKLFSEKISKRKILYLRQRFSVFMMLAFIISYSIELTGKILICCHNKLRIYQFDLYFESTHWVNKYEIDLTVRCLYHYHPPHNLKKQPRQAHLSTKRRVMRPRSEQNDVPSAPPDNH